MEKRRNCGWENLAVIEPSTYIQMYADEEFIRIDAVDGYDNKVLHLMFLKEIYMEKETKTTELMPKEKCKHCSNNTFFIRLYNDGIIRYFCSKCKTRVEFKGKHKTSEE